MLRESIQAFRTITVRIINYRSNGVPFVNDLTVVPMRNPASNAVTHFLGVLKANPLTGAVGSAPSLGVPALTDATALGAVPSAASQRIPIHLQEALQHEVERAQMITERAAPYKIIHVNAAWCRAFGYRADELIGHPFTVIHGPAAEPSLLRMLEQAFASGRQVTCRATCYSKQEQPCATMLTVSPLLDSTGTESHYYLHVVRPATADGAPSAMAVAINRTMSGDKLLQCCPGSAAALGTVRNNGSGSSGSPQTADGSRLVDRACLRAAAAVVAKMAAAVAAWGTPHT